jgi:hypothetical protein
MVADGKIVELMQQRVMRVLPHLDERQRRLFLGAEAESLGPGGAELVARAAGVSRQMVSAGVAELLAGAELRPGRARRAGGGRKKLEDKDPGLVPALEQLLDDNTRGDPQSPLRWTTKSSSRLAAELTRLGHPCQADAVLRILAGLGYSLQGNAKTIEGRQHPDRDGQFRHISGQAAAFLAAGDPVVSVDAKKKEQVGPYAQGGREWRPAGDPVRVRDHSFPDETLGTVTPYGVYDIGANAGFVNVGTDHNTAAFAVASLRRWWYRIGRDAYPAARRLLVTADAGSPNGYRTRAWIAGLAGFAAETGLRITACHFPPGTSKWNKIEHRLFSQLTRAWRGRPLTSHEVLLQTIAATTTRTGLTVTAELDTGRYPAGVEVSDAQMAELEERAITRHGHHGEWNYTVHPPRHGPAPRPAISAPQPPRAARCGQDTLNHPALTGMDPGGLAALAAALDLPFRARREQHLYTRRGRGRVRAEGAGAPRKIDLTDHVLATRLRQHLRLPQHVIAALLGVDRSTISDAISLTASLLPARQPPAAPPPGVRLRTLDDLRGYAASHGITIPASITGNTEPGPFTTTQPDTPGTGNLKTGAHIPGGNCPRS